MRNQTRQSESTKFNWFYDLQASHSVVSPSSLSSEPEHECFMEEDDGKVNNNELQIEKLAYRA